VTSDEVFEKTYNVEIAGIEYFVNYRQAYSPVDKNFAIFASGNDAYHLAGYPAAHRNIIAVSSFGPDFLPAVYTNYGPGTNISAPGGDSTINMTAESNRASILSTVPSDCPAYDTDYGYMEGTSMACPHVSGVAALGLAYAKQQKRHFTWEEFKALMYSTGRDIEEYFVGEKLYYMRHTSAGATPIKMNLADYRGKMGHLINAGALLKAIDGSGRDMRLPNLYLAPNQSVTLKLDDYNITDAKSITVANNEIVEVKLESNTLTIKAKSEGQTLLSVVADKIVTATITVRKGANDNGWL
jgi:subtilisin family serine protease